MCDPQLIINAELANSGSCMDRIGYVSHICSMLYGELMEWITFWDEWNNCNDSNYWITDYEVKCINFKNVNGCFSKTMTQKMNTQINANMNKLKFNLHYDYVDGERLWNKNGISTLVNMEGSKIKTYFNTLDHISSMYEDYLNDLDTMCVEYDDEYDSSDN